MESERERKVRERAYHLWVEGGREHGQSDRHWFQAEQEHGAEGTAGTGSASPEAAAQPAPAGTPKRVAKGGGSVKGSGAKASGAKDGNGVAVPPKPSKAPSRSPGRTPT